MKTKHISSATVREQKAEALDRVVKAELAKMRTAQAAKMSKLKALRLARDAEWRDPVALAGQAPRSTLSRRKAS